MAGPSFLGLGPLQVDSASDSYFINGKVGIGTASPNWGLTLNHANSPFMNWQLNGVNKAELGVGGSLGPSKLGLSNVSSWMTVWDLANGNAGIGTTNPQRNLEVSGASEPFVRVTNTGMGGSPFVDIGMNAGNNAALFEASSGKDMKFRVSGGESLMIRASDGFVGIGTFDPRAKLHVAGRVTVLNFGSQGAYQAADDNGNPADVLLVQNDASYQNATRLRSAGGGVAIQSRAGANVVYIAENGATFASGQEVINANGQVLYA